MTYDELKLRDDIYTGIFMTEDEISACLHWIRYKDFELARTTCHNIALTKGLPEDLPKDKRYSFSSNKEITVVPC